MATHQIGKLKFNLSGKGLDYSWGDGKIRHLFKSRQRADADDDYLDEAQPDGYAGDSYADDGYDDGYDDDGRPDDGYDDRYDDDVDDGYDDDRYDDDGYDDGYDDDGYDDDRRDYDDGYDGDQYDDDGGDDGYGDYDDRYQDEDADEAYGDGDGYDDAPQSPLWQYVEEHDWVTYVLLFLFPPLGIYLLWRRNRFEKPVRWAITIASAIWFAVALILLLRGVLGGAGDQQTQPEMTLAPVSETQTLAPEATSASPVEIIDLSGGASGGDTATDTSTGDTSTGDTETGDASTGDTSTGSDTDATADDGTGVAPSPTPLSGASNGATGQNAEYVWSPASGLYYHSNENCPSIEQGVQVWRVTREIAENSRHQSPCPDCIGGGTTTTYYGTLGGKYYHIDAKCSNMKNPLVYTKQAAENEGKQACPVCILKTKDSLDEDENITAVLINEESEDKSGLSVYATKEGTYYHVKKDCSNMKNATKLSLRDALLAGKGACPTCCSSAGTVVYCTAGGKSYHTDKNCQGMTGAKKVTLAEAMVLGKTKCDVCVKGTLGDAAAAQSASESKEKTKSVSLTGNTTGDNVKVYATQNGTYYHTNNTCSGMKDAQLYTLKSMLLAGKKACPVCASSANTQVYAVKGGKYYHSYATCSGMKNATAGTLADALAAGYKRCPDCWGETTTDGRTTTTTTKDGTTTTTTTKNGKTTTTTTTKDGTTTTSTTKNGTTTTSGGTTRASAAASKATASNTYVYATRQGSYYHLNSTCGGMTGASRISLKTAVKAGKKACPTCASAAKRTVYSTKNGDHYHAASVCAASGMKNGTKRTLAEALMLGQTACPHCLSSKRAAEAATETAKSYNEQLKKAAAAAQAAAEKASKTKSTADKVAAAKAAAAKAAAQAKVATATRPSTYKSGKSGVRVYATVTGKYYHTRSGCSNLSGTPSRVTLETALNYGKKACPVCASAATRKVYATRGGKYYHYSKADAGSGARQGTLASALAYGLDPCPNCVTRSARPAERTGDYKAGTSGIKVYATAGSKYYHSRAHCSGLTGATRVSLETALNYGKKACPVCMGVASLKVYAAPGDKYYHFIKSHAGSGATAGTLARAKAMGLKACPDCSKLSAGSESPENGGTEGAPVSIQLYSADADSTVYVDPGTINTYYHRASTCSAVHFKGGTGVSLQFAVDWGYKACPYCQPPTSVNPGSDD